MDRGPCTAEWGFRRAKTTRHHRQEPVPCGVHRLAEKEGGSAGDRVGEYICTFDLFQPQPSNHRCTYFRAYQSPRKNNFWNILRIGKFKVQQTTVVNFKMVWRSWPVANRESARVISLLGRDVQIREACRTHKHAYQNARRVPSGTAPVRGRPIYLISWNSNHTSRQAENAYNFY